MSCWWSVFQYLYPSPMALLYWLESYHPQSKMRLVSLDRVRHQHQTQVGRHSIQRKIWTLVENSSNELLILVRAITARDFRIHRYNRWFSAELCMTDNFKCVLKILSNNECKTRWNRILLSYFHSQCVIFRHLIPCARSERKRIQWLSFSLFLSQHQKEGNGLLTFSASDVHRPRFFDWFDYQNYTWRYTDPEIKSQCPR